MKNVNESGRSMVEMLGVLAIIGVLSIGGIAGYTLAMNRYRANEILNTASIVAIEAIARNNGDVTNDDLGISDPAGTTEIKSSDQGVVTITFDTVGAGTIAGLVGDLSGGRNGDGATGKCDSNVQANQTCKLNMRENVKGNSTK